MAGACPGISRDPHTTVVPGLISTRKCRAPRPMGASDTLPKDPGQTLSTFGSSCAAAAALQCLAIARLVPANRTRQAITQDTLYVRRKQRWEMAG